MARFRSDNHQSAGPIFRSINPNRIDFKQDRKLRQFESETYKTALAGSFASIAELHGTLLRDLTSQVRQMAAGRRFSRNGKLEEASRLAELMVSFRNNKITPEDLHKFRDELLRPHRRTQPATNDPKVGPNGHRAPLQGTPPENFFGKLKQFRAIATRDDKTARNFAEGRRR